MPKRSSTKQNLDINQLAAAILRTSTEEESKPTKNPHASALGKLGGLKGGKARAAKLTAKRRSAIAKKAAKARWKGKAK